MKRHIASALLCASVAGCAGDAISVVEPTPPVGSYHDGDFDYAVRKGAIYTVVAGKPFAVADKPLFNRVTELMKGQTRSVPARFVGTEGDETDPIYKVLVLFNKIPGYSPENACQLGARTPTSGPAPTTRATMVFCFGDQMKSWAEGRATGLRGLDDPQLAALVRQTALSLVPRNDGHGGDDPNRP